MPKSVQLPRSSRLLQALPERDLARVRSLLEEVTLTFREEIYRVDQPADHVWSPTAGVVSLVNEFVDGQPVEVATIGPEGMVGIQLLLGSDRIAHRAFVQVAGAALRMKADDFRRALAELPAFELLLRRYTLALFNQIAQAAACNRIHTVEERLSRWLLMTQDRVGTSDFPLTKEFIGQMLGVRRPTVSLAAGMLQRAGLIHYVRGRITILDRPGLEAAACECYATIVTEFERLTGTS
jgi:CRP-like cAMP-binding protein